MRPRIGSDYASTVASLVYSPSIDTTVGGARGRLPPGIVVRSWAATPQSPSAVNPLVDVEANDMSFTPRGSLVTRRFDSLFSGRNAQENLVVDDSITKFYEERRTIIPENKKNAMKYILLSFIILLFTILVVLGAIGEFSQSNGNETPELVILCEPETAEAIRLQIGDILTLRDDSEVVLSGLNIECLPVDAFKYTTLTEKMTSFTFSRSNIGIVQANVFSPEFCDELISIEFSANPNLVSVGSQDLPALETLQFVDNAELSSLPDTFGSEVITLLDFTFCPKVRFNPFPDFLDNNDLTTLALDDMFLTTNDLLEMIDGMEGFRNRNFRAPFKFARLASVSLDTNLFTEIPDNLFNARFFDFGVASSVDLSIGFDSTLSDIAEDAFLGQENTVINLALQRTDKITNLPIGIKGLQNINELNLEDSELAEIDDDFFEDINRVDVLISGTPLSADCDALEGIFTRIALRPGSTIRGVDCLCNVQNGVTVFCGSELAALNASSIIQF